MTRAGRSFPARTHCGRRWSPRAPAGKNEGSFSVKTDSGQPWKVLYGVNTRLMKGRDPVRANEIQVGDMIFAAGNVDVKKKTVGAAILIDVPAEEVRKAREGLGKTWAAGKIVAIAGTRIQVHRLDGVDQSIAVDENTSFREKQRFRDARRLAAWRGISRGRPCAERHVHGDDFYGFRFKGT